MGRVITFLSSSSLLKEQIFNPFDGAIGDRFGYRVALSSNPYLVVGAPKHSVMSVVYGAVYLYQFSSPATFLQKLVGPQLDGEFGASLALSPDGKLLLVGAPGCSASPLRSGLVFQYLRSNPFTLVNTISPPVAEVDGGFGQDVALGGSQFIVGEPTVAEIPQSAGAATIYSLPDSDDDGVIDGIDNCRKIVNPDQTDSDGDGDGDVCDSCPNDPANDADGDGVCGDVDNCPAVANSNQSDMDTDGLGDACDADIDGDGVNNDDDNCILVANPAQTDTDQDGVGDACDDDADFDGDGVLNAVDACRFTPPGEVVDADGCSIAQLCPCEHPSGSDKWKNHGSYVSCVAHASGDFVSLGLITEEEKDAIVSDAAESDCGYKTK